MDQAEGEHSRKPDVATRDEQLHRYADTLGVPRDSLAHETVAAYVGALVDVETLGLSLLETSQTRGGDEAEWNRLPGLRLTQRAALAGDVLAGEVHVLRQGFGGAINPDYVAKTIPGEHYDLKLNVSGEASAGGGLQPDEVSLSRGVGRLGEDIAPLTQRLASKDMPAEEPWAGPEGAPSDTLVDFLTPRSRSAWRYESPEHATAVEEQARALGIDPGQAERSVVVRGLLMDLLDAKKLLGRQEQADGLPVAPGLTPSAQDRLRRTAHLTRAAVMILEDGFNGRRLEPKTLAGELNQAYTPYGLQVGARGGQAPTAFKSPR